MKRYITLTELDSSDIELVLNKLGWIRVEVQPVKFHSDLVRHELSRSFNNWDKMKSRDKNRLESVMTAILSCDLVITRSRNRSLLGVISDHRIRVHDPNLGDLRDFLDQIHSPWT